jgi:hypothetical protein
MRAPRRKRLGKDKGASALFSGLKASWSPPSTPVLHSGGAAYIYYRMKIFLQYYGMLSIEMSVFTPYSGDLGHILNIPPFAFPF